MTGDSTAFDAPDRAVSATAIDGMSNGLAEFVVIADGLRFPEGPVVLSDGTFVVTEMAAGAVTRVHADGTTRVIAEVGGGPNGAAVGPDGLLYICNNGGQRWRNDDGGWRPDGQSESYLGGRIETVDPRTGEIRVLYTTGPNGPLRGPNDIVFDRQGGFWFTDMGKRRSRDMDLGGVYYAMTDGSAIREVVFPLIQPNGIGLSPDEDRLYVAETVTGRVWAFELAGPGEIRATGDGPQPEETLLVGLSGYQLLDSLAVDSMGNVCVATLVKGGITVIDPKGAIVRRVPLPDAYTTNICFCGPSMRKAAVTLSHTGKLVTIDWPVPGMTLNFNGSDALRTAVIREVMT